MDADFPRHIANGEAWIFEGSPLGSNRTALGYAVLMVEGDVLHIDSLALLAAHQGQGWGRKLLLACEASKRDRGCRSARLYTNAKMLANQRFYPALGYREVERRHQDGFERVFYHKHLS